MTVDTSQFKKVKAIVVGDLMLDEYLWGNVDRISPEAPVPVVSVQKESHTLGGAGNVVNNLRAMGASVAAVGTAGTGKAGNMIFQKMKELGVPIDGIIIEPERPTTRKTRVIASNQQVLRIDKETRKEINSETLGKLIHILEKKIPESDLVLISDYDKGLVTRELIQQVVYLAKKNCVRVIADPKGLDFSKYEHVTVLTPNRKESGQAANMEITALDDLYVAGKKILENVSLEKLLITCGKDGMILFEKDLQPYRIASRAQQVFDVSGAGDTVISVLGLGLATGATFKESAEAANAAAGIVVAKVGTATASIEELNKALKKP